MIEQTKLIIESKNGSRYAHPCTLEYSDGKIWFVNTPFSMKDEIKAMKGSKWHGFDDPPKAMWSVTDCSRNRFQLDCLKGKNPYDWFERPLNKHKYTRPLFEHQKVMADHLLTYHYAILAVEMGCGKTLSAIEVLEQSGLDGWWWVGPKSALAAVEEEFEKWNLLVTPQIMTYEGLKKRMIQWNNGDPAPMGVIFDESSRLKGPKSQRTQAAMALANAIREEHGNNGYVGLMSGTPSPKSPADWWSQAEVAYPGFLREGDYKAFQFRLGFYKKEKKIDGFYWDKSSWRDDEAKCDLCGMYKEDHGDVSHKWLPSRNEVAYLHERLKGLVITYNKKDCLDLPEKVYREIHCKPSKSLVDAAKMLVDVAPTAIQAITWLRELSDGFQYKMTETGRKDCDCGGNPDCEKCEGEGTIPIISRVATRVKCPKDEVVKELLDENLDVGRIILFAGFNESVDRIRELCISQDWDVVQVDGRQWKVYSKDPTDLKPLKYWRGSNRNVAFVANPASGGMGLTLTEARMAVYFSNDYNPESRTQSEDRGHRPGMDLNRGFTIVDIYNLSSDEHVRNILKDNRRLELMTLGDVKEMLV